MENLIGKNIRGFKILSILGQGGMGVVYKAYDTNLEREVAIKMLHPTPNPSPRLFHQIKKEAKHQAKLVHPNIVMVHGLLEYYSSPGIVMEYVEGMNLHEVISNKGRLDVNLAVNILKQILLGLDYAHSKGFIHRDIKPSNIIVSKDGVVKIMDFGISKSTMDTRNSETPFRKVGTTLYMSPEQVREEGCTPQSDIYSVGCTMYEMLTGYPPFYSKNEFDVMEGHLRRRPNNFASIVYGVPDWLEKIIFRMLEKDRYARQRTCGMVYNDIVSCTNMRLTHVEEPQTPAPQVNKSYKIIRFFIVLFLLVILIGVSYYVVKNVETGKTTQPIPDPNKPQQIERFIK